MNFLNPWRSNVKDKYYYNLDAERCAYKNGDFAVYRTGVSHIYTYKNIAINELVGLNKQHVDNLAADVRPDDKNQFAFDRAKAVIEEWKLYIE